MKKWMLEQMDRMDERYAANIENIIQNMEKLTSSIADGFAILNRMMCQQVQPMAQPTATHHPQAYATPYPPRMPTYPPSGNFTAHSQESPFNDYQNQ